MHLLLLIIPFLLLGCAEHPTRLSNGFGLIIHQVDEDRVPTDCATLTGVSYPYVGCTRIFNEENLCIVVAPTDAFPYFNQREQAIVDHEIRHCTEGNYHEPDLRDEQLYEQLLPIKPT
ncbi:hypothetical protein [Beggiatoa leptomitoformis]|uniref:Uncharacterized protein n=1 Tax=Beggiatoa leptomitoformis TaxID=288004 RepID=A0A2N9YHK7_9GAMM|nr:hypothetical protein [Beggiatoa leptomitoformis]ALG67874.1 hypothetical protein AL038_09325 [Beggiatoa leptomitoformis]AUI69865.1 hypothetical protein BLE401_14975 [Beggiatoa leptomitoformis]